MDSILIRYKYHIKKVTSKTKTKTLIIRVKVKSFDQEKYSSWH